MRKLLIIISLTICLACKQESGDFKVFHYNQVNSATSLDPAFARSQTNIWSVHHIYNTLVEFNDDLELIPAIAESWYISEDGKRYTFDLESNIKFHKNPCFENQEQRILDAQDVVYSLKRIIDPKVNSPGSWIFKDRLAQHEPIKAIGENRVVIDLIEPFRPFLSLLAMKYCSIVPEEAVGYYLNDFRKNPVGTGPLQFKRWIENRALYLNRFDEYFQGPIAYEGVKTSYIKDKKIAFLELLNGKLDFVSGLESSFINELLNTDGTLKEDKKNEIKFYKAPYLNTEYIGINMDLAQESILKNLHFRKALNYAINKEEMLLVLRNNVGKAANSGFIPKGLPAFDESRNIGYKYNLEKAKSQLALSEYDRNEEDAIKLYTNNDYLDIITFVARQWEILGVKVKIELLESSLLRSGMRSGDVGLFRASWIADYPDEENFLSLFYSQNGAPPNYTRFENIAYDKLYEQALKENEASKRRELYQIMNQILIDECPVIFLFYDETALFYSKRTEHPSVNGINLLNVKQLEIN